jgi:hypothetical protein
LDLDVEEGLQLKIGAAGFNETDSGHGLTILESVVDVCVTMLF